MENSQSPMPSGSPTPQPSTPTTSVTSTPAAAPVDSLPAAPANVASATLVPAPGETTSPVPPMTPVPPVETPKDLPPIPSENAQPEAKPKKKSNFLMIVIALVLILLLVILTAVLVSMNNQPTDVADENTEMQIEPITCVYEGETYSEGATFQANDGCNTCGCGADGEVACTLMFCAPEDEETEGETPVSSPSDL